MGKLWEPIDSSWYFIASGSAVEHAAFPLLGRNVATSVQYSIENAAFSGSAKFKSLQSELTNVQNSSLVSHAELLDPNLIAQECKGV